MPMCPVRYAVSADEHVVQDPWWGDLTLS